ncbi:hypothetical protein EON62_02645 [archaeon]|nr:MAG: hypothetical protein EON62_02645 [archaeon]
MLLEERANNEVDADGSASESATEVTAVPFDDDGVSDALAAATALASVGADPNAPLRDVRPSSRQPAPPPPRDGSLPPPSTPRNGTEASTGSGVPVPPRPAIASPTASAIPPHIQVSMGGGGLGREDSGASSPAALARSPLMRSISSSELIANTLAQEAGEAKVPTETVLSYVRILERRIQQLCAEFDRAIVVPSGRSTSRFGIHGPKVQHDSDRHTFHIEVCLLPSSRTRTPTHAAPRGAPRAYTPLRALCACSRQTWRMRSWRRLLKTWQARCSQRTQR